MTSARESRGSASVELMAIAPIAVLFLLVCTQLAGLFSQAVHDVAEAGAAADRAVRAWDAANAGRGSHRPCLEEMENVIVRAGGSPRRVGVRPFARSLPTTEEVRLVAQPICVP
jgi:hypothetical protein